MKIVYLFAPVVIAGLAATAWAVAGDARSGGPEAVPNLADSPSVITYRAQVLDANGAPVDGQFEVNVQVFDVSGSSMAVVFSQTYADHPVVSGLLSIGLGLGKFEFPAVGTGTADAVDVLAAMNAMEIEVHIDGQLLGDRQPLHSTPYAAHASAVSASNVAFGGQHGLVRADVVAETLRVVEGDYWSGDTVPFAGEPGWNCEHIATVKTPGPAFELHGDQLHRKDVYVAHVGCGTVSLDQDLEVVFPNGGGGGVIPPGTCERVYAAHAWHDCTVIFTPSCWQVDFIPSNSPEEAGMPIHVTSICWDPSGGNP